MKFTEELDKARKIYRFLYEQIENKLNDRLRKEYDYSPINATITHYEILNDSIYVKWSFNLGQNENITGDVYFSNDDFEDFDEEYSIINAGIKFRNYKPTELKERQTYDEWKEMIQHSDIYDTDCWWWATEDKVSNMVLYRDIWGRPNTPKWGKYLVWFNDKPNTSYGYFSLC